MMTDNTPTSFPLTLIAGPCSAETEQQLFSTAAALKAEGVTAFRAGIWKPRTRPGCFEGVGLEGLPWLQRVQRELGMTVFVEVANRRHVEAVLAAGMDGVWLGARTTTSPFAVQEVADALRGTDLPVLVKNPICADLELWVGAFERLSRAGLTRLTAVHRGFSSYERTLYRNPPQWEIPIELRRRMPEVPMLCDPSHIAGRRDLVPIVAQQAVELGFQGLMVESHCQPDAAWSDAPQQLTPADIGNLMRSLVLRTNLQPGTMLAGSRERIDQIDNMLLDLLAERMQISRELGSVKREQGLLVLQDDRYRAMLDSLCATEEELKQVAGGDVPPELDTKHHYELSDAPVGKWLSE